MIEREAEQTARCHQASRSSQCLMHGSGMMQDPPCIDHIKRAETAHIPVIKDRSLLDRPVAIARKIAFAQLCRTKH
jgi:hypothetical protein